MPEESLEIVSDPPACVPLICTECGYDLRTFTREQLCPECGTSVAKSLAAPNHLGGWLLMAALLAGVAPLAICLVAVGFMPSLGAGAWLLVLVVPLSVIADRVVRALRRKVLQRCGRFSLGPAGRSAILLNTMLLLCGVGAAAFVAYELRDTTIYAPGFTVEAFHRVQPGMSRVSVESLLGTPFGMRHPLSAVGVLEISDLLGGPPGLSFSQGDLAALYSRRGGFRGYRYLVIYDERGIVVATRCYEYAD